MRSANDEGATVGAVPLQKCKLDESPDCLLDSTAWQAETEALKRLQARATPLGLLVHQLSAADASTAFLVARKSASREFAGLDGAARFVNDWAGVRQ